MTNTTAAWIVHRAGPMTSEGVQACSRCHQVLVDVSGTPGLGPRTKTTLGWSTGTKVARLDGDAVVCVPHIGALLDDMTPCKATS